LSPKSAGSDELASKGFERRHGFVQPCARQAAAEDGGPDRVIGCSATARWWATITMSPPAARNSTAASTVEVLLVVAPISMSSETMAPRNPSSDLRIYAVAGDRSADRTGSSAG